MDKIILPEIEVMACHGVEEWETATPQPFCISVELWLDLSPAAASDDVADTVHYGKLYVAIRRLAETNSFALIETLAAAAARLCLKDQRVEKAKVTVEKRQAKYEGWTFPAKVVLERSRQ